MTDRGGFQRVHVNEVRRGDLYPRVSHHSDRIRFLIDSQIGDLFT